MANLTGNINLGNGARLEFGFFALNEEINLGTVTVELRTSVAAGDSLICSFISQISNGTCTVHARQTAPAAGLPIGAVAKYFVATTRVVPTALDAAIAAQAAAAGGNKAARKSAMVAHWLAAGHIDATLAYTNP